MNKMKIAWSLCRKWAEAEGKPLKEVKKEKWKWALALGAKYEGKEFIKKRLAKWL